MNKQTKVALSIAVLGVGGYLLYKNFTANKKNYTGQVGKRQIPFTGQAGKRQKNLTNTLNVKETNWVRLNGAPKDFFSVKEGFK